VGGVCGNRLSLHNLGDFNGRGVSLVIDNSSAGPTKGGDKFRFHIREEESEVDGGEMKKAVIAFC